MRNALPLLRREVVKGYIGAADLHVAQPQLSTYDIDVKMCTLITALVRTHCYVYEGNASNVTSLTRFLKRLAKGISVPQDLTLWFSYV
jgi:hypothetical protein